MCNEAAKTLTKLVQSDEFRHCHTFLQTDLGFIWVELESVYSLTTVKNPGTVDRLEAH